MGRLAAGPGFVRRGTVLLSLAALALAAVPATANNLDLFGFGSRAQAMGSAFTAVATDWSSAYYNPAGAGLSERGTTALGLTYTDYSLSFDAANDTETINGHQAETIDNALSFYLGASLPVWLNFYDPPPVPEGRSANPDYDCPNCHTPVEAEDTKCPSCGATFRPIVLREIQTGPKIAFSFGLTVPSSIIEANVRSHDKPTFTAYHSRGTKLGLNFATAIDMGELIGLHGLSIGAGVQVLADIQAELVATIRIDSSGQPTDTDIKASVDPDAAATAGIMWQLSDSLSFGLTYRGELSLKIDAPIDIDVLGITQVPVRAEAITVFNPQQIAVGVAWRPVEEVLLAFDLTWLDWSEFPGSEARLRVDPDSPIPIFTEDPEDPGYDDILVPRFGVEWMATDQWALRAGYMFRPSPAPDADGETNLVDPEKHVFTFGSGYTFESLPLSIDAFLQVHVLVEESISKSDPPGDFTAGGTIVSLGINIHYEF